jgi:hypothetical protein
MARELPPLFARSRGMLIHCHAPRDVLLLRNRERAGTRHPGHHAGTRLDELAQRTAAGAYDAPDLDIPTLRVDTSAAVEQDGILLWILKRWQ